MVREGKRQCLVLRLDGSCGIVVLRMKREVHIQRFIAYSARSSPLRMILPFHGLVARQQVLRHGFQSVDNCIRPQMVRFPLCIVVPHSVADEGNELLYDLVPRLFRRHRVRPLGPAPTATIVPIVFVLTGTGEE